MKSKKIVVNKDNFGDLLLASMDEALEYAEGKLTLKSETLTLPPDPPKFSKTKIKKLRKSINVSQPVFASILGVSSSAVKAWEQGDNNPSGAICRLLQLLEDDPEYILKQISKTG